MNYFRKAGVKVGMTDKKTLRVITDHERVNIEPKEYKRILEAMRYYRGDFPNEKYFDYNGTECEREFYDLPMTVIVSEYLADLIINESFDVQVKSKNDKLNEALQEILNDNAFKKNLGDYLSPMFATGGLAVRPYYNGDTGKMEFSWALADAFFPLRSNSNKISEGVFMTTSKHSGKYYTLLEFHQWKDSETYMVVNELYESENPDIIGDPVPLGIIYDDLEPVTIIKGLSRPLFVYLKPSNFNNIAPHSPLGLGVVDNAKKILEQINNTNNQMQHDMAKAKPRIAVSEGMTKAVYDERNGTFKGMKVDNGDAFLMLGTDDELVKDISLEFSPELYISKINHDFRLLERKMKLQQGTFSLEYQKGIKTATQVVSEDSDTFRTRNREITQIETFVKELIVSLTELMIALDLYSGDVPTFEEITVDFDDGIFTNKQQELEFYMKGVVAGMVPKAIAIQRAYNQSEEEAAKWLSMINEENKLMNPMYQDVMNDVTLNGVEE